MQVKKFKAGSVVYTYRADAEKWQKFSEIAQERRIPLSRLLDEAVDNLMAESVEESEEAEDIAYIDSLTQKDYANAVPIEEVIKEFEAAYGTLG